MIDTVVIYSCFCFLCFLLENVSCFSEMVADFPHHFTEIHGFRGLIESFWKFSDVLKK